MATSAKIPYSGLAHPVILIEEVFGVLGLPVEAAESFLEHHGIELAHDWAGRPGLTVENASELSTRFPRRRG